MIDQRYLLSVILENSRGFLITQMAKCWMDVSFQNLGLSLELILDWINSSSRLVRDAADSHWNLILTLTSPEQVPPETEAFLHFSNTYWNQQKSLLWTLHPLLPGSDGNPIKFKLKIAIFG